MKQISVSINSVKHMYGLRIRPFDIASVPKGYTSFIEHDKAPDSIKKERHERDYRFGIIVYPHPLSERDIEHYSLTDLHDLTEEELWSKFEEWAESMAEYEIPFKELVNDFIKPHASLREEYPLKDEKPALLFILLRKKGFKSTLKGLEDYYDTLK